MPGYTIHFSKFREKWDTLISIWIFTPLKGSTPQSKFLTGGPEVWEQMKATNSQVGSAIGLIDDLDAQLFGGLRCAKLEGSICPVFVTMKRSIDSPSFYIE